jgi:UDP-glucose:(heptosyl)LPS alpha-1,3-glucosyltransferase
VREMRLAFVLNNWFPYGGLQRDLVKIVNACQDRADITIYCMTWEGEGLPDVQTVIVPVRSLSRTTQRQQFADFILGNVAGKFDKVVGLNRMPGLDYYFAADTCFAEKSYNERGWWYRQTPRAKQYLAFEAAVFGPDSQTRIMLLSPSQREEYTRHYHTPAERLYDLPPGIGREHMATADAPQIRAEFRKEFGITSEQLLVLQVGSSFATKGVSRSLQALAALPAALKSRTQYFLVGHDNPSPWLREAEALGVKNIQVFAGRNDIPRWMQGADLLLHPSVHESAGMVLLEAIVAGLPVLTTANCGYAFHVERAEAGVVCPEPFEQDRLNTELVRMLESERSSWKRSGIRYGQEHNLYSMPEAVANILLNEDQH